MEALKIVMIIVGCLIGLYIILNGIGFKIAKFQVYHSGVFKDDYKNLVYQKLAMEHKFQYLCSWLINIGLLWVIISIILKIIK